MTEALIPLGFIVGATIGWFVRGILSGREIERYRQGVMDAQSKNGCWIKTQLPFDAPD